MRPTVTAPASERGWGSWPTTCPAPPDAVGAKACTVATVAWVPPPKTRSRPPSTAPAASWPGVDSWPRVLSDPPGVLRPETVDVEVLPEVRPPSSTTWPPAPGRATSRLRVAGSAHGTMPDSMAGAWPRARTGVADQAPGRGPAPRWAAGLGSAAVVETALPVVAVDEPGPGAVDPVPTRTTTATTARATTPKVTASRRRRRRDILRLVRTDRGSGDGPTGTEPV